MKRRRFLSILIVVTLLMTMSSPIAFGAAKKVSSVKLSKTKVTLYAGKTTKLTVKIRPAGASKSVSWKSSNKKVATVTSKGVVKARKAGKATITCTSKSNKKKKAECVVTVKEKVTYTDDQERKNAEVYLSRTGDALYSYLQDDRIYYRENTNGDYLWILQKSAGVVKNIEVYEKDSVIVGRTYCSGASYPILTLDGESDAAQTIKSQLDNGTYDYSQNPAKVLISWNAWGSATAKEDFEKTINGEVSDTVFDAVKAYAANDRYFGENGGSRIVIYGKNTKGTLVGKYAGGVSYTSSPTRIEVDLIGINSECTANYGKSFSYSITYSR